MKNVFTIIVAVFLFLFLWLISAWFIRDVSMTMELIKYILILIVPGFSSNLALSITKDFNNIDEKIVFSSFSTILFFLVLIFMYLTRNNETALYSVIQSFSALIGCFYYYKNNLDNEVDN